MLEGLERQISSTSRSVRENQTGAMQSCTMILKRAQRNRTRFSRLWKHETGRLALEKTDSLEEGRRRKHDARPGLRRHRLRPVPRILCGYSIRQRRIRLIGCWTKNSPMNCRQSLIKSATATRTKGVDVIIRRMSVVPLGIDCVSPTGSLPSPAALQKGCKRSPGSPEREARRRQADGF